MMRKVVIPFGTWSDDHSVCAQFIIAELDEILIAARGKCGDVDKLMACDDCNMKILGETLCSLCRQFGPNIHDGALRCSYWILL